MPRVKFDYIVSFSSEDPDNPASNLLAWEVDKKKWLCSKGEPSCSVVLQLNKAVKICSVNIGAHQAALVEVLVGRSETPNDPFQVLVPSSVFQTPGEARRATPADADKVRSFGPEVLADTRLQRWDRLRVVCTQPYNKHCKFGLSFVHVYCEGESLPAPAPALPARLTAPLDLHSSDEEEFRPGELFAKHLRNPEDTVDTGAQIRQATSHALRNIPDSSIRLSKASIGRPPAASAQRASPASPAYGKEADRLRDREAGLLYTADDDRPNDRVDRVVNKHNEQKRDERKNKYNSEDRKHASTSTIQRYNTEPTSTGHGLSKRDRDASSSKKDDGNKNERKNDTPCNERKNGGHPSSRSKDDNVTDNGRKDDGSRKRRHSDKKDVNDAVSSLCAGAVSSRPHTLLADVVFVLSGYENPRRADLRNTALALGASCRRDWGPGCTHLICAFPNTPKLRSVRASPGGARAVAVRGEWVEETARTRRRLPWQWFATEDRLRAQPPPAWEAAALAQDPLSECDTDDEIERVRQKIKKRRDASPGDEAPAERVPAGGASPGDEAPAGCTSPVPELDLSAGSDVTFVRDERVQGSVTVVDSDSCGGSTEEEDGAPPSPGCGGRLPALFAGRVFSIRASQARAALLRRYLLAYGGLVSTQEEGGEVDYVVCDPPHSAGEREAERGVRVRAAWVWRCHEARALLPPEDYLLAGS